MTLYSCQIPRHIFSERDKGDRFERLMQAFLQTVPWHEGTFRHVWLGGSSPTRKTLAARIRALTLWHRRWKGISGPSSASAIRR